MDVEDDVEIIVDTEMFLLCRLCINNKGKFQIGKVMQKNLQECFDITINSFDGMSQIACEVCKNLVLEIVNIRETFRKNQDILVAKRKKLTVKDGDVMSPISLESDGDVKNTGLESQKSELALSKFKKNDSISKSNQNERVTEGLSLDKNYKEVTSNLPKITKTYFGASSKISKTSTNISSKLASDVSLINSSTSAEVSPKMIKTSINIGSKNGKDKSGEADSESCISILSSQEEIKVKKLKYKKLFDDSDESTDENVLKNLCYKCVVCEEKYYRKSRIERHLRKSHKELNSKVMDITKPCVVKLHRTEFDKDKPSSWLNLRSKMVYKFSPQNQLYMIIKSNTNSDRSSSDDDDNRSNNSNGYKRILNYRMRKILNKKLYNETDDSESDRRSVDESSERYKSKPIKLSLKKNCVYKVDSTDSERSSVGDNNNSSSAADNLIMSEEEITKMIEMCYQTAKNKSWLTAPVDENWLVEDMKRNNTLDVVWVNSPYVKVSRISSTQSHQRELDNVPQLPPCSSNEGLNMEGHLKLVVPPKPSYGTEQENIKNMSHIKFVGKNVVIVSKKSDKENATIKDFEVMKRSMDSGSYNDPPSKRSCIIEVPSLPGNDISSSPEEVPPVIDALMPISPDTGPIIVSTVSLANNPDAFKITQEESVSSTSNDVLSAGINDLSSSNKPLIKCKPTSALMPSLAKPHDNATLESNPRELSLLQPIVINSGLASSENTQPLLSSNELIPTSDDINFNEAYPNLELFSSNPSSGIEIPSNFGLVTNPTNELLQIPQPFPPTVPTDNPESIIFKLQQLCANMNVVLRTYLSIPTKYCKLLKFVLTIKERKCNSHLVISSEFIVEVCLQVDGVLVINVGDYLTNVDIRTWSNDFQNELVVALRKPEFLETMKRFGKKLEHCENIVKFTNILEKFYN